MKLINKLANKCNRDRMTCVKDYLERINVDYYVQYVDNELGNLIVDFKKGNKLILFIAHYDVYKDSSGANDNASGVCVLLRLLEKGVFDKISCRIIFTTMEEVEGKGIETYINEYGIEDIFYAVNIDTCGWGECVVVCERGKSNVFCNMKNIYYTKFSPYGDDVILEDCGIDVISISTMNMEAYECLKKIGDYELNGEKIPQNLINTFSKLELFETMHCGNNDTIEIVSQVNINKTMDVVCDVIRILYCNVHQLNVSTFLI